MNKPKPILTRRQRFFRYALRLFLSLAILYIFLDFPIPTADLARRATERRAFFGPSQVLCTLEEPIDYDRSYLVRWQDWYGVVSVQRDGLFWNTGRLLLVENDPEQPLVVSTDQSFFLTADPIFVISNDPSIVRVVLERPVAREEEAPFLQMASQDVSHFGCFLVEFPILADSGYSYCREFRLSGYDSSGALVWRSPTPPSWEQEFGDAFA